jgi:hypothetical protein
VILKCGGVYQVIFDPIQVILCLCNYKKTMSTLPPSNPFPHVGNINMKDVSHSQRLRKLVQVGHGTGMLFTFVMSL